MSEGIRVVLGQPVPLSLTLFDGASGQFPRARVYDSADAEVSGSPFNLTEVGSTGRYTNAAFTPIAIGTFTARFVVYSNAGHTIENLKYQRDQDSFRVAVLEASATDAIRILGLSQDNYMLDEQSYDAKGLLEKGRIRIFANAVALADASAGAADNTDSEIQRYNITVVATTPGEATDYRVEREL